MWNSQSHDQVCYSANKSQMAYSRDPFKMATVRSSEKDNLSLRLFSCYIESFQV